MEERIEQVKYEHPLSLVLPSPAHDLFITLAMGSVAFGMLERRADTVRLVADVRQGKHKKADMKAFIKDRDKVRTLEKRLEAWVKVARETIGIGAGADIDDGLLARTFQAIMVEELEARERRRQEASELNRAARLRPRQSGFDDLGHEQFVDEVTDVLREHGATADVSVEGGPRVVRFGGDDAAVSELARARAARMGAGA